MKDLFGKPIWPIEVNNDLKVIFYPTYALEYKHKVLKILRENKLKADITRFEKWKKNPNFE